MYIDICINMYIYIYEYVYIYVYIDMSSRQCRRAAVGLTAMQKPKSSMEHLNCEGAAFHFLLHPCERDLPASQSLLVPLAAENSIWACTRS